MRKAIIATLSVLIVLLFIACNTRVNYNKYLIAIDSLIVQQPDTALSMLEAFPTNSLQTQADSAYYGLLMTEARDKNYIIQTNDSLIQSALTYYNGTNDIEKRARAHYYSGCVYRDSQRRTESMTQYLIAKPLAEKAGERRLLSLIYLNIGYLYYSQNLNTQADSSYQLAQQIGIQLKDSVLQAEVLSRRGLIRMEKGEEFYPEAEKMMLKALAIVQKQSNIQLKENVFSSLCQLYNWMENGEKAIEFAKQNLGVQKDRTTCYKAFELLGSAYYLILQYDSARHYLQKSLFTTDYATKAGAYMYLADIAKEQGDLATSLEMERNYSAYLDSVQKSRQPDAIVCAEQGMPSNKQNIISKHTHYSIISISIITLTLIVAVIILSYKKRKQKPNNRTEKEMLYKAGLVLFEQSEVYNKMTLIIRSHKEKAESEIMHQGDWLQLIAETNKCWNNIARELQSKYHLTEDEIYLCCLYLTGAGIDICDINKNGTPDLLMMVYDAPEGENSFRYQIAFDLQSNGNYLSLSPVYEVPGLGHDGDGAGVAVGDIDNNGTLDILFMALDAPSGKDKFVYEILPDIDKYGNSYAKPIYTPRFPDSLSPCDTGQGAACCLYDLDNNGFLDAIFVAIENIKGKSNSWKYVTGHNLNKQGVPMCWR